MASKKKAELAAEETPEALPPAEPQWVQVYAPDGAPFWERHPDHPGGEVWIAGHDGQPSQAVAVALTPFVRQALRYGRLDRVAG